ncbi:MAG: tetratricopeptide repeat protein [Candidatus Kapaibacterium sp.]
MARLEKLQALLELDPADSFTRYAIGLEFAKAGKFDEAIRTLEELREQDPTYVPTYYMLAGYYRKSGDNESAKLIYEEGIVQARTGNDRHAMSELQAALDELEDETE